MEIAKMTEEIEDLQDSTNKFFPKFRPFNEFILVRDVDTGSGETISKGGIIVPDTVKKKQDASSTENLMDCEVIAVSDGILNDKTGELRKPLVEEGWHVWISTHHRTRNPQPWGKEEVRVIQEGDIVAALNKTEYEKQLAEHDSA